MIYARGMLRDFWKAFRLSENPTSSHASLHGKPFWELILYNNCSETRNLIEWSMLVQDQTILHAKFKFAVVILLNNYQVVFRGGQRDPYTWDVARVSESVKKTLACASCLSRFPKVSQHLACMDLAILHRKPFGFFNGTINQSDVFNLPN